MSEPCTLSKHSRKPLCPSIIDPIPAKIEVHQLPALSHHSCKSLCSGCSNFVVSEIEVSQRCVLCHHSFKPLCILSFHITVWQLECDDAPPGCQPLELPQNEPALCLFHTIVGVVPDAPDQVDNGRHSHLVHYLFDSLRGPSQHDRPASCPSPAPVVIVLSLVQERRFPNGTGLGQLAGRS